MIQKSSDCSEFVNKDSQMIVSGKPEITIIQQDPPHDNRISKSSSVYEQALTPLMQVPRAGTWHIVQIGEMKPQNIRVHVLRSTKIPGAGNWEGKVRSGKCYLRYVGEPLEATDEC